MGDVRRVTRPQDRPDRVDERRDRVPPLEQVADQLVVVDPGEVLDREEERREEEPRQEERRQQVLATAEAAAEERAADDLVTGRAGRKAVGDLATEEVPWTE